MRKKLFLIDGTALIYRAYFAFIKNPLYTSQGVNTSAMFGTFNMFISFLERYHPEYVMISFDRKEKTFRHKMDENYKKNRPPAPAEMIEQLQPIKDFFAAAGVLEYSKAGYEADDIIGSLAVKFSNDFDIIIVSGDKDFAQIINKRIVLYDPKKEAVTDIAGVKEKYGITPEQFIDYLALCGDSADNIPGVKGVGPKTASKLLLEYGSLDTIYENIAKIKSASLRNKLEENRDNAYLSRQLAAIVTDLPLDIDVNDLKFSSSDLTATFDILQEYELNSLMKRLKPPEDDFFSILEGEKKKAEQLDVKLIDSAEKFDSLLKELSQTEEIAIDTETTSLDPLRAELVGISLCFSEDKAYYLPLQHKMADNVDINKVIPLLQQELSGMRIIAHNLKYDFLVLQNAGWELPHKVFDTMVADYLLQPDTSHSLAFNAFRQFGFEMTPITDLIGKGKKQITFDLVSTSRAAQYSGEDAWITWKLYKVYKNELKENNLEKLFYDIEIPLIFTLAHMERSGVYIDETFLKELSGKVQKRIGELTKEIFSRADMQFNLNSTQQLAKVLFDKLKLPPQKKTKTGYSVDQSVLEKLAENYEIAEYMLEYRMLNKLDSTYISALPSLINPQTGRIHSSFNQTVASTGRLSSTNPNLQNIPIRSALGKEVRKAFSACNDDLVILSADYSQIELRIFAILTQDETLISTFRQNKDIHSKTASIIYKVAESEVNPDQRRYAKVINFGLLYGMGAYRISRELNISHREAQKFIDEYFANFPTVKDYIGRHLEEAAEKGYVETIMGRRLYLPDLNNRNNQMRKAAERIAVNMPVQGSAADLIKLAMNKIDSEFYQDARIKMLIQVHDELVFEVRKEFLDEGRKKIVQIMENALPDKYRNIVPLKVDASCGKNWFEAH